MTLMKTDKVTVCGTVRHHVQPQLVMPPLARLSMGRGKSSPLVASSKCLVALLSLTGSPARVNALSASSCAELGWTNSEAFGNPLVCGESDGVEGAACSGALSLTDARLFCSSKGARLCTLVEIQGDEARATGCSLDLTYVWTDTPCVQGPTSGNWIEYGSSSNSAPLCRRDRTLYNVRCCADEFGNPAPTNSPTKTPTSSPSAGPAPSTISLSSSAKNCDELGWGNALEFGSSAVCGESDGNALGVCSGSVSWAGASGFCENAGARLCTVEELLNHEARATGCQLDVQQVWSSTICAGGYSVAFGGALGGTETACAPVAASYPTRCCADVEVANPVSPTRAPTPSPSRSPTESPVQAGTITTSSAKSCDELGWGNALAFGSSAVCGESDGVALAFCSGSKSWAEQFGYCQNAGARLCTLAELLNDEARATGCQLDAQQVWSSTPCAGGFSVAFGGSQGGTATACAAPAASFPARCCADVEVATPITPPTPAPPTASTTGAVAATTASVLTVDVPGSALVVPPDCIMTGTPLRTCTLTFGAVTYATAGEVFTTRGYQKSGGYMGGPVIRVRAGETFSVVLNNVLTNDNNTPAGANINEIGGHLPNSTNLHTHGLHISGLAGGDNVFLTVAPMTSTTYTYTLPPNHQGGSFFYHPHHHGSIQLQHGGGATGMIIVEDEAGSLPAAVLAMEEVPLVLTLLEPNKIIPTQQKFNTALWQVVGNRNSLLLTNGQTSPTKAVLAGKWYRFRVLFSSDGSLLSGLAFQSSSGGATCEMQLLAKDGMYLMTAPRAIATAYLPPGGRADIAVRCTGVGTVNWNAPTVGAGAVPTAAKVWVALQLNVQANAPAAANLALFTPYRPCYLADTRLVTPARTFALLLGTGDPNTRINTVFFESPDVSLNPTAPFVVGTANQLSFTQGTFVHVVHIHVNSFQITTLSPVINSVYFQVGDWHDTFNAFVAQPPGATQTVVRFWADRFAGRAVVHCHMSQHEDEGMMNTLLITGVEGATVDAAARVRDPLCYSTAAGMGFALV